MSAKSQERDRMNNAQIQAAQMREAQRMLAQAQAIDPDSNKVCIFRSTIPELEKMYVIKRDTIGTPVPGGLMLSIKNPRREGNPTPFSKCIEIFGAFAMEILDEDPSWWIRKEEQQAPASNVIQMP